MAINHYNTGLKLSAKGEHARAILHYEQALAANPDDAPTLFALGNTARALDMDPAAAEFYRRAQAAAPDRIEPIVNLASLLRAQGQFEAAEALLLPPLARHPGNADLRLALGNTYREMGDAGRAAVQYRQALLLRPDDVTALGNLADLLADDGRDDEARALYDHVLAAAPGNAQARLNRAIFRLSRGDLEGGWDDYAARLRLAKAPLSSHGLPPWDGGPLKGLRLLVTAEQGIGDQVMFAGMMPDLAARAAAEGGSVLLECEPRLAALFARSFPSIGVHRSSFVTREGASRGDYRWLAGRADAAVEMGTLPRFLRPALDRFPAPNVYLRPDAAEAERWREALHAFARPHIGICWRSGSRGGHRAVQYAPIEAWAAFVRELPGTIVIAQYDATPEEIATLERLSGRSIVVPRDLDQKNELDRCVALFSTFDAMVSAPTAVAWLAAGAGVPSCKVQYDSGWTSFGRNREYFAPAAFCAVPQRRGDWPEAFDRARAGLSRRLAWR